MNNNNPQVINWQPAPAKPITTTYVPSTTTLSQINTFFKIINRDYKTP